MWNFSKQNNGITAVHAFGTTFPSSNNHGLLTLQIVLSIIEKGLIELPRDLEVTCIYKTPVLFRYQIYDCDVNKN